MAWVDVKVTARLELAVADNAAGVTPSVCAPGEVKLIVCAVGEGAGAGAGAGDGAGVASPPPQPVVAAAAAMNMDIRLSRWVERFMGHAPVKSVASGSPRG